MKMKYNSQGEKFLHGLPVGNGRLGAVSLGAVDKEQIFLNDDSVWYGGFRNRVNPDALSSIEELRKLIFEGKAWQAEKLAFYTLTSTPESERAYQPLGKLDLQFFYEQENDENVSFLADEYVAKQTATVCDSYSRELCLESAVASVGYSVGGVQYEREMIASFPDGVIAHRLKTSKAGTLSFVARLSRDKQYNTIKKGGESTLILAGKTGDDGVEFCAGVSAVAKGGSVKILGQHLIVDGADEVVLYVASATSFYEKGAILETVLQEKLAKAIKKGYAEIKKDHIADYKNLFDRVGFHIESGDVSSESVDKHDVENCGVESGEVESNDSKNCDIANNAETLQKLPIDERIRRVKNGGEDIALQEILYHYGRYLQISSSRVGSLPMNLQGIWNDNFAPPWDSKFTININQEMLYWGADIMNVPECSMPIFDLLERMHEKGTKVAKEMYGCSGFVAHHNTDLWADCAPQDIHRAAFWCLGGLWLSLHIWDYYDHHRDEEFLRKYFYILEDAVRFALDFIIEDKDGYLVTCPSHSPENGYYLPHRKDVKPSITYAPTMDNMLLRYAFAKLAKADEIIGANSEVAQKAKQAMEKLHPTKIGKHGQIMEWVEDYDEPEPGHRHMAHLFALHPADDITPFKTPKLATAAKASIDRRLAHQKPEDGKNGWTLSWMMLFEARLMRAEKAYAYVQNMLKNAIAPNMFGLCVTDEIYVLDGNVGMVSAMTELCVQSHGEEIHLLPALPKAWGSGYIKGIKARGGFVVDVEWENGKLKTATITATVAGECSLRTHQNVSVCMVNGEEVCEEKIEEVCKQTGEEINKQTGTKTCEKIQLIADEKTGTFTAKWQAKAGETLKIKGCF